MEIMRAKVIEEEMEPESEKEENNRDIPLHSQYVSPGPPNSEPITQRAGP